MCVCLSRRTKQRHTQQRRQSLAEEGGRCSAALIHSQASQRASRPLPPAYKQTHRHTAHPHPTAANYTVTRRKTFKHNKEVLKFVCSHNIKQIVSVCDLLGMKMGSEQTLQGGSVTRNPAVAGGDYQVFLLGETSSLCEA